MSLTYIGPLNIAAHYDPSFEFTSSPDSHGIRDARIAGFCSWETVETLSELLANDARRISFGSVTGVLERIWFSDDLLKSFSGWYLLDSLSLPAEQRDSVLDIVGFTLTCMHLGAGRRAVVTRSARIPGNDNGIPERSILVQPFWGDDSTGEPFETDPGGTAFSREYDDRTTYDPSTPSVSGRSLRMYEGVASPDALASVAQPTLRQNGNPPSTITFRGGDVTVYDRRDGRLVGGPAHHFLEPTDILVSNGIIRFWCGPAAIEPYVNVQAFIGGAWREVGVVALQSSAGDVLERVLLKRLTTDVATVELRIRNAGPIVISLRRGERMLRATHGSSVIPVSRIRQIQWFGTPPPDSLDSGASVAAGKFGNALRLTSGLARWKWPSSALNASWSFRAVWIPDAADSSQPSSTIAAFADSAGQIGKVDYLSSSKVIRFVLGSTTLSSAAISFSAGAFVDIAVSFSTSSGMGLSVKVGTGAVAHVSAPTALDPGTTDAGYASLYLARLVSGSPFAGGLIDNVQVFERFLTESERGTLLAAATALGGLPGPEGALVLYLPFDARLVTSGSGPGGGIRNEVTIEGGNIRNPDANGLTKGVASLDSVVQTATGLILQRTAATARFGAFLATTATKDDLTDHFRQLAADFEQEVRVR